jgi:hypothetical protein
VWLTRLAEIAQAARFFDNLGENERSAFKIFSSQHMIL